MSSDPHGLLLPSPGGAGLLHLHSQFVGLPLSTQKSLLQRKSRRSPRAMCHRPRFVKFSPLAHIPNKATPNSVGYDLRLTEDRTIYQGGNLIDVALGVIPPDGYYGQLFSRSGLGKKGVFTVGGVIDPDYRGSIGVILHNNDADLPMRQGDAITQLVFLKYSAHNDAQEISMEDFKAQVTVRGDRGFGSSSTLPPTVVSLVPPPNYDDSVTAEAKRQRLSEVASGYNSAPEYGIHSTWNPAFSRSLTPAEEHQPIVNLSDSQYIPL